MRKMDYEGLTLCALQAEVFKTSLEVTQCSSPIFIRRFMHSEVASLMDRKGFLIRINDAFSILEEVEEQYGPTSYGQERYGGEELYWMGYLYRYWTYTYEKRSKQVYRKIKPKELRKLYYPYHSLDPAQAIERIMEAAGLEEEDYIRRGVQILRELRQRERERQLLEQEKKAKDQ